MKKDAKTAPLLLQPTFRLSSPTRVAAPPAITDDEGKGLLDVRLAGSFKADKTVVVCTLACNNSAIFKHTQQATHAAKNIPSIQVNSNKNKQFRQLRKQCERRRYKDATNYDEVLLFNQQHSTISMP